jgi:rfaE bifunctional protein kinase chain/domain
VRAILRSLEKTPVVIVGDVVLDRYVLGTTHRISREAPVPVVLYESESVAPGGAANAAVNVTALGARAVLLGVVGPDGAARRLVACVEEKGVRPRLVGEEGRSTAQKIRVLAGAQGTRHQQVLRLDRDPAQPPGATSLRAVVTALRAEVRKGAQAVLLSDYGQGLVRDALLGEAVGLARQGMPVVVDSRYGLRDVRGPVVLKPNAPELAELVGAPVRTAQEAVEAARVALRRTRARAIVATRGREGMVVLESRGTPHVLAAHPTGEVTDVTGAGDTVAATLAVALGAGVSLWDAARLANVAASVVVGKLGAATATPDEIEAAWGPEGTGEGR